jgi:hypothetical protein
MSDFKVPLVARGRVIEDYKDVYADRSAEGRTFVTPSVDKYINEVVCQSASELGDLYQISFNDIVAFLAELGTRLNLDKNPFWREAFEASCHSSNLSPSVLEAVYRTAPKMLQPDAVREVAEQRVGIDYLEGWVSTELNDGRTMQVRAIGSRALHIVAGNVPTVSVQTLLRSAITRSDAIVKAPSNDPLTMNAIARTMIDIDPKHPLTRHLTVAYWRGGDAAIEEKICQPRNLEKIIAWGGMASIRHIAKYVQPGLDLICMDPKTSITVIGREAFKDVETTQDVARRAASDMGTFEQEACSSARVIFIESGTDAAGLAKAKQFGELLFKSVQELPKRISAGPNKFDRNLKAEIEAISQQTQFYTVITDPARMEKTGAVIVSDLGEKVDFVQLLSGRVSNVIPIDDIEEALRYFNSSTQTVGLYPNSLISKLRDRAAIMGGQRLVSLGYMTGAGVLAAPHDGLEVERRMVRWAVSVESDPAMTPGGWMHDDQVAKVLEFSKQRRVTKRAS